MFQPCTCVSLHIYEKSCLPEEAGAAYAAGFKTTSDPMATVSVGLLVSEHPERARVLEQFGIDYCCGGKSTLKEACDKKGIRLEEVLKKFAEADRKGSSSTEPDWTRTSLADLIDDIVTSYHQPLRKELPRLAALLEKVAKAHGDNHPETVKVLDVFKAFRQELELHMQKEELILFPGIKSIEAGGNPRAFGCGGGVEHPIEMMIQEHDAAGDALSTMRQLTNNFLPPQDACNTYKILLQSLAELELEMHQHVHKENNILFPRTLALAASAPAAAGSAMPRSSSYDKGAPR
jgi:regulator of cell morphogenesis and NO signaling